MPNPNIANAGKKTQFSADNQPENRGRKKKTVSDFLKQYGESSSIEFEITTTDAKNKKKVVKGKIESGEASINQLVAVTILKNAIDGDNKAITTLLERTEGKVSQNINLGGQDDIAPITFKILKSDGK